MKTTTKIFAGIALACSAAGVSAQEAPRTAYFLDGYTFRHQLNPAFSGERNYISIPALGNLGIGMNSNVGVNTFLYKLGDGRLTTFMSPTVDASTFLGKLQNNNHINLNTDITLLSAGFRAFHGFNTITVSARVNAGVNLPKDLFTFMKLGQDGPDSRYSFGNLQVKGSALGEVALGHSHRINDRLEIGAKVKLLFGIGHVNAKIDHMDIRLSGEQWLVDARGQMNFAAGKGLRLPTKAETGAEYNDPSEADLIEWNDIDYDRFSLSGFGLGFDLGATYKLMPNLTLSASLLDLGFVGWKHNFKGETSNTTWTFDGFRDVALNSDQPDYDDKKLDQQLDNMWDDLQDCVNFHRTQADGSNTEALGATLHLGAEYAMPFYEKLTAGFLFTQRIAGCMSWTEGRFSANVKPVRWFDATINYAASTYGSSFGWMLNFHPKGFNFFVGSDHQFFKVTPQYVPVGHANASINLGFNVTFGS